MNELQAWRDWAANILGVYYNVNADTVEAIRKGDDEMARLHLSLNLGMGSGAKASAEHDLKRIVDIAESGLARLADTRL